VCRGDVGRLYLGERRPAFRVGALAAAAAPGAPAGQPAPAPPAAPAPLVNPAPPPPELPLALVRNGREFRITGSQSTVRAGTEVEVKTERPVVTLSLSEMDQGSWVIFKLPGFTTAASGTAQSSLDALRRASGTSYFRDGDDLWVKLVVTEPPVMPVRPLDIQASVAVSRDGLGG